MPTSTITSEMDQKFKALTKGELSKMTGSELVNIYNTIAPLYGKNTIVKFRDLGTAIERTLEVVKLYQSGEETKAPAPKEKKAKQPKATRRMRFVFVPGKEIKIMRNKNSLRVKALELLAKGAKFNDVVDLINDFDKDREQRTGKKGNKNTIQRRAYELVRKMHYDFGYGINHDMTTDFIQLYTELKDKK